MPRTAHEFPVVSEQLDERLACSDAACAGHALNPSAKVPRMDPTFRTHVEALPLAYDQLLGMEPTKVAALCNRLRVPGVYLLSEGSNHLYVGRTVDIGRRLSRHLGTPITASFAFLLAREATGKVTATYRSKGSRKDLARDPVFAEAFDQAKARIKNMDTRYLEVADPVRQCLLEIYVALTLETRYNEFATH